MSWIIVSLASLLGVLMLWTGFELGKRHARLRVERHRVRPTFLGRWNEEGNFLTTHTTWNVGPHVIRAEGRHDLYLIPEGDVIGLRGQLEVNRIIELRRKNHFDQWKNSLS